MKDARRFTRTLSLVIAVTASFATLHLHAGAAALRFDCGAPDSPVAPAYQRLTADDAYTEANGFGWETAVPESITFGPPPTTPGKGSFGRPEWLRQFFHDNYNDLNRDAVISESDLVFRADVPEGTYRVTVTIGDMTQPIGSMDVYINDQVVAEHVAAWTTGSYRLPMITPAGWWTYTRSTVEAKDGLIRIALKKNQSYYDEEFAKQAAAENPYVAKGRKSLHEDPPFHYIGWPFVHNCIMAIEIVPHVPAPMTADDDTLKLTPPIDSRGLTHAIGKFNERDFEAAAGALDFINEPDAQVAKAQLALWLVGRPEIELTQEKALLPLALDILRNYVASNPDQNEVAEALQDAEAFYRAFDLHITRGEPPENHFIENNKAIAYWLLINEGTPLYYKSRLYIARAAHMLVPYFPIAGVEEHLFKELEKKFPENRYVKYHLYQEWEAYGDGSRFEDWYMVDYAPMVQDSPEWVRQLYPAWAGLLDFSEWWIGYKQKPEGTIGGGWGDDVEIVGLFGYMGYTSRGVGELALQGTRNLVEGMWNLSEVDPDLGYCLPMADAEHSAEWTGNTLGMMVQIDYSNPFWIEAAAKTAKLMRDLWTDYNDQGRRHFKANFFGATQVGAGMRMNDSWINYRAIRPASAVLSYNGNPSIRKLILELADSWTAAALSTDRGKPKGVIPAHVAFPDGLIGGHASPNWFTPYNDETTINDQWVRQGYKDYIQGLLVSAFKHSRDPKYLEPLRLEYELAAKYGYLPEAQTAQRLQSLPGKELPAKNPKPTKANWQEALARDDAGSEAWTAEMLAAVDQWLVAKRLLEGRKEKLENDLTKDDIIRHGKYVQGQLYSRWPIMTTEAGPTDRVGFRCCVNPFLIYTGGWIGGPLLEAAVTYDNTTKAFAAAVLGSDPLGFRLIYHSLTDRAREIGIVPWHLQPGAKYLLRYGPDADEDEVMDSVTEREFDLPQLGTPIRLTVQAHVTYIVEVDQLERPKGTALAPDPALSYDDIYYNDERHLIMTRIHNVGSTPVRGVNVTAYDGDPENGGTPIGTSLIPNIEAPINLQPMTVTVAFPWVPANESHEIYIVIDPDNEIKDEITTFNNVAHTTLPKKEAPAKTKKPAMTGSFRRGR